MDIVLIRLDAVPHSSLDLYSLFRGTTTDVSGLIDIIPSYLFPKDEKTIEEFWMTGISLGGEILCPSQCRLRLYLIERYLARPCHVPASYARLSCHARDPYHRLSRLYVTHYEPHEIPRISCYFSTIPPGPFETHRSHQLALRFSRPPGQPVLEQKDPRPHRSG